MQRQNGLSHPKEIQGYPISRQGHGDGLWNSQGVMTNYLLKGSTVTGAYYVNDRASNEES